MQQAHESARNVNLKQGGGETRRPNCLRKREEAMDWSADVKRYAPNADAVAINAIIKHLGIALQKRDSSLVACDDKAERDRIRDHFLKKRLGLMNSDAELDKAIIEVCQKMHGDHDKSRVAFYYLLAEKFHKLATL
jgi:hypothetical protein